MKGREKLLSFCVVWIILCWFKVKAKIYFQEDFSDGDKWQERWILSEEKDMGFFILTAGKYYGHPEISKGVQAFQNGKKYGISTKFTPFTNYGKTLVLQYTVKNEQHIKCSGGYIKLFNCSLEPQSLNITTPYLLMFGPDKCIPHTFKVHVIINYKGKYLELKKEVLGADDKFTHVYTLIIYPDNTYEVKLDYKDMASGKLKEDWKFLQPEEISDYDARKPRDWVDNPTIEDPNDVKPAYWDEVEYIPDPTSTKPSDWDNDLDGVWEPPLIENPDFKGQWKPRRIPNPNYKGPWVRPRKKNPRFVDDPHLYSFDEICAVGIEVWQGDAGTIFDNLLITDDTEYAEQQSWKVWGSLKDKEKEMARNKKEHHLHDEL